MTHHQEKERSYKIERDLTACAVRVYMAAKKRVKWSKIADDLAACGYSRSTVLGALMVMLIKKEIDKDVVWTIGEEFPEKFFYLTGNQNHHDQSPLS